MDRSFPTSEGQIGRINKELNLFKAFLKSREVTSFIHFFQELICRPSRLPNRTLKESHHTSRMVGNSRASLLYF